MSVYLELSSFGHEEEKPLADEKICQDLLETKSPEIKFQDEEDFDQSRVYNDSDEEPDVEDLESSEICADNHTTCVNENIDAVKEVFDEETCLAMLVNYYEVFKEVKLDETTTRCALSGCEFDYSSNTYRIHVELTCGSITIGEHFLVVKIDPCTGFPKICSIK